MRGRTSGGSALTGAAVKRRALDVVLSDYFVWYLCVIYAICIWPVAPDLFTGPNMVNVLSNTWPLLLVAVGQTFVLISAGIDLSQTSAMAVGSVLGAMLMSTGLNEGVFSETPVWGWLIGPEGGPLGGVPGGVLLALLAIALLGAVIGWINGSAITRFGMPAFMVTLVGLMFYRAFAIWLSRSENVSGLPDGFLALGKGVRPMILALVLVALAHLILAKTMFGRHLYAIGTNPVAARVAGIRTATVITGAYVLSSVYAVLGGALYSSRLGMGQPTLAPNLLFDVVGAAVIGGTSLFGGKGKVLGTIFGVVFFVLIDNTMNLLGFSFFIVMMVKGALIVAAATFDAFRQRLRTRVSIADVLTTEPALETV